MKQKQAKKATKVTKVETPVRRNVRSTKKQEEEVVEQVVDEVEEAEEEEADVEPMKEDNEDCEADAEVNEEEDEDDEMPTEEAIDKSEPTLPSKVKNGPIAEDFPIEQIIHVTNLPKKCKLVDIVEAFAKFGPIDAVHGPANATCNVAFKTVQAANDALAANKKCTVKGTVINVQMKKSLGKKDKKEDKPDKDESRDRSVYVKFLKRGTTEDQLKEHFDSCGEIESIRIVTKNSITFAFVAFCNKDDVQNAVSLHNSVLNNSTIGVFDNSTDAANKFSQRDPKHTIMLKNKQHLENIEGQKLQAIFEKCGEISSMDVVCKKNSLAFITFKTEEAVAKAFKLSGQTIEDIEVEIEAYNPDKPKTSIFIINLSKDVTEEDLNDLFSKSGEISAIILKKGFAIIHFKDSEGYCKSFLLNETLLKGQMIFLEPHSVKKKAIMKRKYHSAMKRPAANGNSVFSNKKSKTE